MLIVCHVNVNLIVNNFFFFDNYRFFQLMGSVFSFVSSDLKQKIDHLNELMGKEEERYVTVKSMIEHEKENQLLEKPDYSNGSRTLLRLHRGLGNKFD